MKLLFASLYVLLSALPASASPSNTVQSIVVPAYTLPRACAQTLAPRLIQTGQYSDITLANFKYHADLGVIGGYTSFTGTDTKNNRFTGYIYVIVRPKFREDARSGERESYWVCELRDLTYDSPFVLMNSSGTVIQDEVLTTDLAGSLN